MAQAFNLAIQPTLKTKDRKIIAGIAAFVENSDIMRKELEKRALRAAKEVAPERTGGLKKAIEITNSNPLGYTLGVSENITSGKNAASVTKKVLDKPPRLSDPFEFGGPNEWNWPESLRDRYISPPERYVDRPTDPLFNSERKPLKNANYARQMRKYRKRMARMRAELARKRSEFLKKPRLRTKTINFQRDKKRYRPFADGGDKVRSIMQEFGYPYKTLYWGPYKPNPKAPKGPAGLGYLRLGQVLAAKSLTKDSVNYSVAVSEQDVIRYVDTITKEMTKAYTVLLAKYLRKQKLPAYYKEIDTLKQKAPIPERALAYGNVTNLNLQVPLEFPETVYSASPATDRYRRSGLNLSSATMSIMGRPFEEGYSFLIDN